MTHGLNDHSRHEETNVGLSPSRQEQLKAQAEAIARDEDDFTEDMWSGRAANAAHWTVMHSDVLVQQIIAYGQRCHALGVSSERERLTKFVADWRRIAKASDVIYGELNREAEALRECAEEIETAFALAAPSSAVPAPEEG